jgi:catechol 2,3-dioxygenase-like lactoylglutathione lyase family enzyme
MINQHLKFHHLGLAVKKPEETLNFLKALGYRLGEVIFDPEQNVYLSLCVHDSEPDVEIVWPTGKPGPIDGLTWRYSSGIVYHVCYSTDDLAAALSTIEQSGLKAVCVSRAKPAPLFGGRKVSFYNIIGMGLVEILE